MKTQFMNYNVVDLQHLPEQLDLLAQWHHQQWSYLNPGQSVGARIEKMRAHLSDNAIPSTYIAFDGTQVLGSASIVESDMDSHPELGPWLASVFVAPEFRKRGVGAGVVRHVVEQARKLAVPRLFLFTPDKADFYQRLGWQVYAREEYRAAAVTLMFYEFTHADKG